MKIIILLATIAFLGVFVVEAESICLGGNCMGIQRYDTVGADYTGSQYNIKVPDLFIDDTRCENRALLQLLG